MGLQVKSSWYRQFMSWDHAGHLSGFLEKGVQGQGHRGYSKASSPKKSGGLDRQTWSP